MSSVPEQWARIEAWLGAHRPDLLDLLNPPASEREIALLAEDGVPEGWLELYRLHNGGAPVFFDWDWVPVDPEETYAESVQSEWERMAEMVEHTGGWEPPRVRGPVRALWASERWLPIAIDYSGCSLCIDLDPAEGGQVGQLIEVEEDERRVLHADPVTFLRWLADGLERGEIHLASPEEEEEHPPAPRLTAAAAEVPTRPAVKPPAPPAPAPAPLAADADVDLAEGPVERTRALRVEGRDLFATVALSPAEAASGINVDIVGPEGPVTVALPAGAGHGARLRLPGLGLGGGGDLHVEVAVELPVGWEPAPGGRCKELRFEGWDVVVEVALLTEERRGATVPVATHAEVVDVAVPAGATEVRAEGLGLPRPRGERGDLVVVLR